MFEAGKSKSAARIKEPACVTVNVSQMLHFKILNFVYLFSYPTVKVLDNQSWCLITTWSLWLPPQGKDKSSGSNPDKTLRIAQKLLFSDSLLLCFPVDVILSLFFHLQLVWPSSSDLSNQ